MVQTEGGVICQKIKASEEYVEGSRLRLGLPCSNGSNSMSKPPNSEKSVLQKTVKNKVLSVYG
jgi:hypothetical protein